jgi:hypothetical protein
VTIAGDKLAYARVAIVLGRGWEVWHVRRYDSTVSWHGAPRGCPIAQVDASTPDLLITGCRLYEATIDDQIAATEGAIARLRPPGESGVADDARVLLSRVLEAQCKMKGDS